MPDETTSTPAPATTSTNNGPPEGIDTATWELGHQKYHLIGSCVTCHQATGLGLSPAFPPLAESEWVTGPVDNLVRILLQGLQGPLQVKGQTYNGAMTPQVMLQNDEEVAAVLTYVRNSFGNKASVVTPEMVAEVRPSTLGKGMLTAADLAPPKTEAKMEVKPVTTELPEAENYTTFPHFLLATIFLLLVVTSAAKLIFLGDK